MEKTKTFRGELIDYTGSRKDYTGSVSDCIRKLIIEGYKQDQAVAIAKSKERRGEL